MLLQSFGIFGEVLFDRFADGFEIMGGAPFNVAWHLQAFGQTPQLISRVGSDRSGEEILASMRRWGLSDFGVQIDRVHPTGIVTVSIANGEPGYIILDNQAYDFISKDELAKTQYQILYHGSLALRHKVSREALLSLKSGSHGTVFMDVNLRAPWWDMKSLQSLIADADWLKLNEQEFIQLDPGVLSMERKMLQFIDLFQLEGIIVTNGNQGAKALSHDGNFVEVKPENKVEVVDTVGAGDAFAAVILLGLQKGWPLRLSMQRAQGFASALVGQRGATVENPDFYKNIVRGWE